MCNCSGASVIAISLKTTKKCLHSHYRICVFVYLGSKSRWHWCHSHHTILHPSYLVCKLKHMALVVSCSDIWIVPSVMEMVIRFISWQGGNIYKQHSDTKSLLLAFQERKYGIRVSSMALYSHQVLWKLVSWLKSLNGQTHPSRYHGLMAYGSSRSVVLKWSHVLGGHCPVVYFSVRYWLIYQTQHIDLVQTVWVDN